MNDIRDALIWLLIANAALIVGATFHTFAGSMAVPLMVAFMVAAFTLYAVTVSAAVLGVASLVIGLRK